MAVHPDREQFIPIRCTELVDLLCASGGSEPSQQLGVGDEQGFRRFAERVVTHYHLAFHERLIRLKDAYAPFDPDADTKVLRTHTTQERALDQDHLFEAFIGLLRKANYRHMTHTEIEQKMQGASYWGLDMDICWDVFDRVEMFYRGSTVGRRRKRGTFRFWKVREITVPIFQRMVIILKQKEHKRLGANADTEHVFLKMFKDIPQVDLEMLLPGTKLKMPRLARGKLGASLLSAIAWVGYKLSEIPLMAFLRGDFLTLYGPIALVAGYGYRTWSGFQTTKQAYTLALTQSLYYQNLDNNAGVLYRLLDEAEEQECREVLLSYFYLWRYAGEGGWTADQLDDYIEQDLERQANVSVDFEIEDGLGKLERLGLVEKTDGRYRVPPVERAIELMDRLRGDAGRIESAMVRGADPT
jgi:Protein of unknown function (DUF3754)